MTATPPGQPRWRLVADFAADLDTATKDRVVDLLADAALGADPAADVYAGRPSPWPATDPCRQVSGQPATPGDTLQLAAGRFAPDSDYLGWEVRSVLGELVNQLDAAPATYMLPAEPPPEVDKLWDRVGLRWDRDGTDARDGYRFWRSERGWVFHYPELLMRQGPLSTCPPTDTEEASTE